MWGHVDRRTPADIGAQFGGTGKLSQRRRRVLERVLVLPIQRRREAIANLWNRVRPLRSSPMGASDWARGPRPSEGERGMSCQCRMRGLGAKLGAKSHTSWSDCRDAQGS
jgi:hypothetical protein